MIGISARATRLLGTVGFLAALWSAPAGALSIAQIDTFEDGTTQGWQVGDPTHPAPPVNIATGGPGGAGDNYLQLTAVGSSGPGSRLSAFNFAQWAGDYIAAGITSIYMDVNNFGPDDLSLRLLFADPAGGPPSNVAVTDAVLIPAGSGWQSIVFSVVPADLIAVIGDASLALANATELRIFHNPDPDFPGPGIGIPIVSATLGVDNISPTAPSAAVAEPAGLAALGLGLIALGLLRRRRG